MARRDLSNRDASDRAASELQYVIRKESKLAEPAVRKVSAEQAMRDKRFFAVSSDRNVTRVLFISYNTELLNPTTQSLDGYINIKELFDEVHILILRTGIPPRYPVLRAAPNVWLYTASAKHWWQTPFAAFQMLENELVFAAGFRADLIVARDPFESAVVAFKAAEKYGRPTQLHILEDYSTAEFLQRSRQNFWRLFLPFFTVPRFSSIRTATSAMLERIQKKQTILDIDILPRYQNYEALIERTDQIDLKAKYKPFIFFLVYVGRLDHTSTLYRALDAARFVLRNQRVGMIVLGDGSSRGEFEQRAKMLGIERQVVFETKVGDVVPYLKSANLLVVTDTDQESEEVVLKGAATGVPMVMARTEKREDVFVHGESAFLCEASDVQAFTDRINDLLNNIGLRHQFVINAQDMIREQFHHDPRQYREAYRASIEQAFFAGAGDKNTQDPPTTA
jgi:glycosyltransferase involved in cell wall biosynthesis